MKNSQKITVITAFVPEKNFKELRSNDMQF